jgi:Polyketide cyclase / dehydrase and lipid transport
MLGGDQTITLSARAHVRADAGDAFAFLATPSDHRRLQVPGIRVLSLDHGRGGTLSGGAIALEGPLHTRRMVHTRVTLSQSPCRLAGSARLNSGTEAHVSWTLRPAAHGTLEVELTAVLGPIATADRLALALGGRRWVQGRFEQTLRRLAAELERPPGHGYAVGRAAVAARGAANHRITQPA